MAGKSDDEYSAGELLDMKLKDILARIAFAMECEGASEGDVGKLVFDNDHYAFSVTVVKKSSE